MRIASTDQRWEATGGTRGVPPLRDLAK